MPQIDIKIDKKSKYWVVSYSIDGSEFKLLTACNTKNDVIVDLARKAIAPIAYGHSNDKMDVETSEAEALPTPPTPEDVGIRAGDLL